MHLNFLQGNVSIMVDSMLKATFEAGFFKVLNRPVANCLVLFFQFESALHNILVFANQLMYFITIIGKIVQENTYQVSIVLPGKMDCVFCSACGYFNPSMATMNFFMTEN